MLKKNNLLFSVGPVEMRKELIEVNNGGLPYFRTSEFSSFMIELEKKLLKVSYAPKGSRALIITASGTAGMEAAIINSFTEKSKVLVVNGGSFGARFVKIMEIHGIPYDEIKLEKGKKLHKSNLNKFRNKGYDGFVVNANETSTGVLYDLEMIGEFCKEEKLFLVIDAISSFISDEYNIEKIGANISIISSQKALGISPGLSVLILDSKGVEVVNDGNPKSLYLDLKEYLLNMERGQTPFTPDIGAINELDFRLNEIIKIGVEEERKRIKNLADDFRKKIKDLPLEIFSENLSNTVTSLEIKNKVINAYDLYEKLKKNYKITILPSGGELKEKLFRVGHIGNLKIEDNDRLINALKKELM